MSAASAMSIAERLAAMDSMRIDVGMALSASRGVMRTVTVLEPDYTSRSRHRGPVVVDNLSFDGGDESVPALLRKLADLIEAGAA